MVSGALSGLQVVSEPRSGIPKILSGALSDLQVVKDL
jgi:hypothetical protein